MELNTQDWKEFVIGKILECNTTVLSIKDVLEDGTVPFISRTAVNNGCDGYVDVDKSAITKGDCLTEFIVFTSQKTLQQAIKFIH